MNFKEVLNDFMTNKKRTIINGMGSDTRGLILEVTDDYITYELLNTEREKTSGKERTTRELLYIQISNIFSLSEGEKQETTNTLKTLAGM